MKKTVFANAEKVAPATAVFATNTSSLSITEMAADLEHPERVVGFHFFNPVAVMPLLEIIKGEQTSDAALATAFAAGKGLGKTTILVQDSPSFIVNRCSAGSWARSPRSPTRAPRSTSWTRPSPGSPRCRRTC